MLDHSSRLHPRRTRFRFQLRPQAISTRWPPTRTSDDGSCPPWLSPGPGGSPLCEHRQTCHRSMAIRRSGALYLTWTEHYGMSCLASFGLVRPLVPCKFFIPERRWSQQYALAIRFPPFLPGYCSIMISYSNIALYQKSPCYLSGSLKRGLPSALWNSNMTGLLDSLVTPEPDSLAYTKTPLLPS